MSRYSNKKFDEIVKAKISPLRNAVISRTEKIVRSESGSKIERGYLIAQQMEVMEGDETTKVFIKGGSLKLSSIDNVVKLRDALNTVLEVEGHEKRPKHTCKCEDSGDECNCGRVEEASVSSMRDGQRQKPKKKYRPEEGEQQHGERHVPKPNDQKKRPPVREEIPVPEPDDSDYDAEEEVDGYYEDDETPEEERDSLEFEESEDEDTEDDVEDDQEPDEEDGGWEY